MENTENNVAGQATENNVQIEQVEKTFTQSEFNEALKNEVARKTKGMPSKEDLKAFNEWKESQKTESEKMIELTQQLAEANKKLDYANQQNVVANAGVDSKFQRFVHSEVSILEGDFQDNLTNYLKENPQYLTQKPETKPQTTGFAQNRTNVVSNENQAYLDKKYANNPYYKK